LSEEDQDSFQLIDAGADLLGSLAGAGTAIIHGDVSGLLQGAGVAHAFRYGARLFANRFLPAREKARVGFVYGLAAQEIKRRIDRGEHVRTDGFFDRDTTDRSPADEIAEAVLTAAQKEHEERKLPYIAKLLASVAFQSQIDQGMANYLVKLASGLTYRQYCLLEIANGRHRYNLQPPGLLNRSHRENPSQVFAVLAECFELYRLGLVTFTGQFGPVNNVGDMSLQSMTLDSPMGAYLHLGLQLQEINPEDVANVAKLISAP
jgi:hypothetical protein